MKFALFHNINSKNSHTYSLMHTTKLNNVYDYCNLWLTTILIVMYTSLIIQTAMAKLHRKGTHCIFWLSEFFCNIGMSISNVYIYCSHVSRAVVSICLESL